MSVRSLCTDRCGSVAVEFIAISVVLLILLIFMTDLVVLQANVGKLDRTAYSVAGVLRERIQLFEGREMLTRQDVNRAEALAKKMLSTMHNSTELSRLQIYIEEIHFKDPIALNDLQKKVAHYRGWQGSKTDGSCLPPELLKNQQELAPRGSYGRWVPLYQVTLCLPTTSWLSPLLPLKNKPPASVENERPLLSSFAIVMLR